MISSATHSGTRRCPVALGFLILWLLSCQGPNAAGPAPDPSLDLEESEEIPRAAKVQAPPPSLKPNNMTCVSIQDQVKQIPAWTKSSGFVITQVLSSCLTPEGHEGYQKDSSWVAMGFPCTGGKGKTIVAGSNYAPKMVSLILATDCPMEPMSLETVRSTGQKILGLDPTAKLLALNPMAVQYWETDNDSDVGFTIELRSIESRQRVWRNFIDKKPLNVRLYGRENAWVMSKQFYEVTGQLWHNGNSMFRLEVQEAKSLNESQINDVKTRCQNLRPKRDCHRVFN